MGLLALSRRLDKQQGFALITVMLIVALIAMISGGLLYQQAVQVQRSSYLLHQSQAMAVVLGLERWVKKGLLLDVQNNTSDHLNEQWAQPLPPVPFAGGQLSGQLQDLDGRLNLNNLAIKDSHLRRKWQDVIQRFFRQQWQQPQMALVIEDWVDADSEVSRLDGELGAESDVYLLKQPSYRAANQPLVTVSELNLLQGASPSKVAKIKHWVATLPGTTLVNVNTAPKSVLLAFADWVQPEWVQNWIVQRKSQPAKQTADFRKFIKAQSGQKDEVINLAFSDELISVQSHYFRLDGFLQYGEVTQHMAGLFYRPDKKQVFLIQRWQLPADSE